MKINLVLFFSILLFSLKAQVNDFISVKPNMEVMQEDLNIFRTLTEGLDTIVESRKGENTKIEYIKIGKKESLDFTYENVSFYYWSKENRKGYVNCNGVEIHYILNLMSRVKKISVNANNSEKKLVVRRVLGMVIVGGMPDNYRRVDNKKGLKELLLALNKEMPR